MKQQNLSQAKDKIEHQQQTQIEKNYKYEETQIEFMNKTMWNNNTPARNRWEKSKIDIC